ncbi:UNVERIFIED_CONTAM: hypothetical protein NCL1_52691 [Trichonephila clavipes]
MFAQCNYSVFFEKLKLSFVTSCLRLKYVKIPRIFPSGLDVVLTCDFDLEGETLYAIKWFHDGKEFYRYSPEEEPKTMFFPARGIKVDVVVYEQRKNSKVKEYHAPIKSGTDFPKNGILFRTVSCHLRAQVHES